MPALLAAPLLAAGELTAVYTYDAKSVEVAAPTAEALAARVRNWASACRITPGGALYTLECPPPPEARSDEPVRFEASATVALLRDLDETVYVAACPALSAIRALRESSSEGKPEEGRDDAPVRPDDLDRRDCEDLDAGQTYPAETFEREIRLVTLGRRFALTLYRREPKPRTTRTPYELAPTRGSLGRAGPETTTVYEPLETPEITWTPNEEPAARAGADPARKSLRDPGPARTDLRVGLLRIECSRTAEARIFVDGVYLGRAPLEAPLVAGRHELTIALEGEEPQAVETRIEAGATKTVEACRGRP